MVTQYFTYRELPTEKGMKGPDEILRKCFKGLDFKFMLAMCDCKNDSRKLGMIEAQEKEHIGAIIEALASYGVHKKTPTKAQAFYEYATGIKIEIKDKKLFFRKPTKEDEQKEFEEKQRRLKDEQRK